MNIWIVSTSLMVFFEARSFFVVVAVFKIHFIEFLQRRREDRELETSMREKHRPAASCTPPSGDVPATNVHALDWN